MDTIISIASMSIKAVNTFFNNNKTEHIAQLIKQNNSIIEFMKNEYINQKYQILNQANTAMEDSLLCHDQKMKERLLDKAYDCYTKLMNYEVSDKMPDGSYFDNSNFICCGYYGRFCVFGIQKEYKTSTAQVYECAIRFPEKAIQIFNRSFFSKIDCSELMELCENLYRINHFQPTIGIYEKIPDNMAKALIEIQIEKYKDMFNQILTVLRKNNG